MVLCGSGEHRGKGKETEHLGMRVVVAPQEYKGTLTAREAADAIAEGVRRADPSAETDVAPVSDGGPGLSDVLLASLPGRVMRARVQDPLGREIDAEWALLDDGTAIIEMAAAAGYVLLGEDERDPRVTSTYGVGQLVSAALDAGARRLIGGVGGSATNDGGAGMAEALGVRFLDAEGQALPQGGGALAGLDAIDHSGLDPRLAGVSVVAAADVTNPLCGPEGASLVYGPQKGASTKDAGELDSALWRYADVVERDVGVRVLSVPGAGAAGGLGAGLIDFLAAEVRSGFDLVAEVTRLPERIASANLVLTGEGRLDGQTAYGKTVAGVAALAREAGVLAIALPGSLGNGWEQMAAAFDAIEPVAAGEEPDAERLAQAAERAIRNLTEAADAAG
jgi:glycerate kinase